MTITKLSLLSLWSRRFTVALTILAIALSVALFVGVEKLRQGARASFADTISDTDLIIGARSGGVQLLLYSVFRIGNATNGMSWESYQDIVAQPQVNWAVPISLGDSHRQFRVMGTTPAYFERYKYRGGTSLAFGTGVVMDDLFDAVIGADVAEALGYAVGDAIVVAHGLASFSQHSNTPFRISGILEKTGTPVDRTVIVSLEAIEAIHVDWQSGAPKPGEPTSETVLREMDLTPKAITAAMVGVDSRLQIFTLQRAINEYAREPLSAIVPGVALQELWSIVGIAETALSVVSGMVVVAALLGMAAMLLAGLNERRREMAILRSVGAGPSVIVAILMSEAVLIALCGAVLGMVMLNVGLVLVQPLLDASFGIFVPVSFPGRVEFLLAGLVVLGAVVVSVLPAIRAYKMSLSDGMMVKL